MTSRLVALCLDAVDPWRLARFWAGLLGRDQREDADGVLVAGDDTQVSLWFVSSRAAKLGPNRVHLHLTSASQDDQQRTVEAALRLGASHLDVGQRPDEGHVVLADPGATSSASSRRATVSSPGAACSESSPAPVPGQSASSGVTR